MVRRAARGYQYPKIMKGVNVRSAKPSRISLFRAWCAQAKALGFEWVRVDASSAEIFANCTSGNPNNYDFSGMLSFIDAVAEFDLGVIILFWPMPPATPYFRELATGDPGTHWDIHHRPPVNTWGPLATGFKLLKTYIKNYWGNIWRKPPNRCIFEMLNESGFGGAGSVNSITTAGVLDATVWAYLNGAGIALQGTWDSSGVWNTLASTLSQPDLAELGGNDNLDLYLAYFTAELVDLNASDEYWIMGSLEGDLVGTSWKLRPTAAVALVEQSSINALNFQAVDYYPINRTYAALNSYIGHYDITGLPASKYGYENADYIKKRLTLLPTVYNTWAARSGVIITETGFGWDWPTGVALSTSAWGAYMGAFWERTTEIREIRGVFLYELRQLDVADTKWGPIASDDTMAISAGPLGTANGVEVNASKSILGITSWA